MKKVIFVFAIASGACNSHPTLESDVKKYMLDSVVPRLNDPPSYQFVSMEKPDSISAHAIILAKKGEYLEDLQTINAKLHTNNVQTIADKSEPYVTGITDKILQSDSRVDSMLKVSESASNEQIAECDKALSAPDSLHHLNIKVTFRGKNKMGGLVLDDITLHYFAADNRIERSSQ